jgi:hypothetical protein
MSSGVPKEKKGNPGPIFLDSRIVSQSPRLVANDLEVEVRIVGVGDHVGQYVDCCLRAIRANSLDIQQEALDLGLGVVNLQDVLRVSTRVGFVRFQRGCFKGASEGADEYHGAVRAFGKVNHALNLDVDFRFHVRAKDRVNKGGLLADMDCLGYSPVSGRDGHCAPEQREHQTQHAKHPQNS